MTSSEMVGTSHTMAISPRTMLAGPRVPSRRDESAPTRGEIDRLNDVGHYTPLIRLRFKIIAGVTSKKRMTAMALDTPE